MGLGVYIASKTCHAPAWRMLRDAGWPIKSTWIDEANPGQTKDFNSLWSRCLNEASSAERLILYVESGEILKGGFIEVGAALSHKVPVMVVGPLDNLGTFHKSRGVYLAYNLEEALRRSLP